MTHSLNDLSDTEMRLVGEMRYRRAHRIVWQLVGWIGGLWVLAFVSVYLPISVSVRNSLALGLFVVSVVPALVILNSVARAGRRFLKEHSDGRF